MAEINIINICWVLISVRVPQETLPTKVTLNYNINDSEIINSNRNNDDNDETFNINNSNKELVTKIITVIIITTIKVRIKIVF